MGSEVAPSGFEVCLSGRTFWQELIPIPSASYMSSVGWKAEKNIFWIVIPFVSYDSPIEDFQFKREIGSEWMAIWKWVRERTSFLSKIQPHSLELWAKGKFLITIPRTGKLWFQYQMRVVFGPNYLNTILNGWTIPPSRHNGLQLRIKYLVGMGFWWWHLLKWCLSV